MKATGSKLTNHFSVSSLREFVSAQSGVATNPVNMQVSHHFQVPVPSRTVGTEQIVFDTVSA